MKPEQLTPSAILAKWKRTKNYKNSMQFSSTWPELVRMREGQQWSKTAMKKWKNFPFITVNQLGFIVENKKSNILAQSVKMIYSPAEVPDKMTEEEEKTIMEKSSDYTDLAQNIWDMVDQDQLNVDAVDDCLVIGTSWYHYFFDSSTVESQYQSAKGKVCGEIIDSNDIGLGNPQLKPYEGQKQPWYIVKTYENTEQLKETSKKHGENWMLITPDKDNDEEYQSAIEDTESADKTVAYTMYYKEKGEVWWVKVTGGATVQKFRKLAPTVENKKDDEDKEGKNKPAKFTHYPIEPLVFRPRKKSTFGLSVIEDSISMQKGVNFLYSMIAYGVQGNAWPKILAKAGALIGNSITNEPGEIITDHDVGNPGDSVKYMQPPTFSNMPPLLIDKLTDAMRQTTGANEVNAGEAIGANMAAAAINLLQAQARKPNEQFMKQVYATNKRIGKIYEDFAKCYFILPRSVTKKDAKGKLQSKTITPSEYKDYQFDITIDVGAGGEFTEAGQFTFVQGMYDKKDLTKYQYTRYAPSDLVPQEMKSDFEAEEQELLEAEEEAKKLAEKQAKNPQQPVEGQVPGQQPEQAMTLESVLSQLEPDEREVYLAALEKLTPERYAQIEANPQLLSQLEV